jgi:hypothetical protein
MYEKLVGKRVKVVHKDGSYISVTEGTLREYSEDIKTLHITTFKGKDCYITASAIEKLEVLDE